VDLGAGGRLNVGCDVLPSGLGTSKRKEVTMAVEIKVVYQGKLACEATHRPSSKTLITDAPTDNGGNGASFSPTDLVATALGSCVLTILGLVSERHDLDLSGCHVTVTKEMIQRPVRRIGGLRTVVQIPADRIIESAMRERLEAAARKCPVHQSLHPEIDAPIEFVYG
jgi:putative redox protein